MKIVGYSERGAMNALFYGMAFSNKKEDMQAFLSLAGINEVFRDASFFMEPSLSGYGEPDLIVSAVTSKEEKVVIFVEAKVSTGNVYDLQKVKNEFLTAPDKNHNNLFYQLYAKQLLFRNRFNDVSKKLGKNARVLKLFKETILAAQKAYYVAIVPDANYADYNILDEPINFVSWKEIFGNKHLRVYIEDTMNFNNVEGNSQILNKVKNEEYLRPYFSGEFEGVKFSGANWRIDRYALNDDRLICYNPDIKRVAVVAAEKETEKAACGYLLHNYILESNHQNYQDFYDTHYAYVRMVAGCIKEACNHNCSNLEINVVDTPNNHSSFAEFCDLAGLHIDVPFTRKGIQVVISLM